jgi:lysophospholipase L1-like esterase
MKHFFSVLIKKYAFVLLVVLINQVATAQPFANEIAAFKKADSINFPAGKQILFIGSSSFTKWKDVQNYFPGYPILNRGFGGSTLVDVNFYCKEIIYPYNPKQVIIYCGENDIASSDTVTTAIVLQRFKMLFNNIRKQFPQLPITFISIKPCPSRWLLKERMIAANKKIKHFLKHQKYTQFINVWDRMLDENGMPMKDIFIEDDLHMNAKGYSIWQKVIQPILIR